MKVFNMPNNQGRAIPNQLIIQDGDAIYFQSYGSIIAKKEFGLISLDVNKWNYSTTTSKYRNRFLGETTKETETKIKSGEYILTDLNT
jgi:hypothetical protein